MEALTNKKRKLEDLSVDELVQLKKLCTDRISTLWRINGVRRSDPAILDAVNEGNLEEVKRLFRTGVSLDSQYGYSDSSALHVACCDGKAHIVEFLLVNGASINILNQALYTPLDWAVYWDRRNCIPLLLMNGADDTICENVYGKNAFEWAESGYQEEPSSPSPRYPYAEREVWNTMKANMWEPTRDLVLGCVLYQTVSSSLPATTMLSAFVRDVPDALLMMKDIMSFVSSPLEFGPELNPRFLARESKLYENVATDVIRAFHSTVKKRKKPLSYFVPFINEGREEGFSLEWIREMMRVLVIDCGREMRLNEVGHGSLEFDEVNDIVSLV